MGIMIYSLLWVMQDLYHQQYVLQGHAFVAWRVRGLSKGKVGVVTGVLHTVVRTSFQIPDAPSLPDGEPPLNLKP